MTGSTPFDLSAPCEGTIVPMLVHSRPASSPTPKAPASPAAAAPHAAEATRRDLVSADRAAMATAVIVTDSPINAKVIAPAPKIRAVGAAGAHAVDEEALREDDIGGDNWLTSPPMANRTLVMELVGEPESGAAVVTSLRIPVLSGTGSTDYACGACQVVIAASLKLGEIDGALIRCPRCGRVNRPK